MTWSQADRRQRGEQAGEVLRKAKCVHTRARDVKSASNVDLPFQPAIERAVAPVTGKSVLEG